MLIVGALYLKLLDRQIGQDSGLTCGDEEIKSLTGPPIGN